MRQDAVIVDVAGVKVIGALKKISPNAEMDRLDWDIAPLIQVPGTAMSHITNNIPIAW